MTHFIESLVYFIVRCIFVEAISVIWRVGNIYAVITR